MRTIAEEITSRGADLVLVGNGDPEQGTNFLEETKTRIRLLVDPALRGYRAATLERRLLAPYSPRGFLEGLRLWLRGTKPGFVQGDNFQLGGVFVIAPGQRVEYSFVSSNTYQSAPLVDVLATLDRISEAAGGGELS